VTTLLTGVLVALAAGIFPMKVLDQLVSMGTLLAFALVCGGVLILRRTAPHLERPFRTPWMPWIPIAGVLACLYLMIGLPLVTWIRLVVWLVIGLAIYFGYGHRNAEAVRAAAPTGDRAVA
jgi:APA family basic amino acid/polyamine antiporter